MFIKEKFIESEQLVTELENSLKQLEDNASKCVSEMTPFLNKIKEIKEKYDFEGTKKDINKTIEQIRETKRIPYLYFAESVLKFMLKIEEDMETDDFYEFLFDKSIDINTEFENCLSDRDDWYVDTSGDIVYDEWDDLVSVCCFDSKFTPDELQNVCDELLLLFGAYRILTLLKDGVDSRISENTINKILKKYGILIKNKENQGRLILRCEDERCYVSDIKNNNIMEFPDCIDFDIVLCRLSEEFCYIEEKIDDNEEYSLYLKLREKYDGK